MRAHQSHRELLQAHQRAAHALGRHLVAQHLSYTGNNRTHMIRIPDNGRFELRLSDGATNPYLPQAAI